MTLPSVAMSVFGFNFYDEKYQIKMIPKGGPLEKFIREAYFGGNVGASFRTKDVKGKIKKGFHYDMNSQYPKAMLNKLPIGDPVFSTNTDLSYYFGFVYALMTPPSESELKNLYIQYRDNLGKITCPREPFYRWIPSFELEQALKDKYKAQIFYGINFPESSNVDSSKLFEKYVTHFYNKKKNAKDNVEKNIAKLMLNSLYGKFGQKDIENRIKIVSNDEANKILKCYHVSYFTSISDENVLIKYSSKLNEKLRRIYSKEDKLIQLETNFKKERGVVSAVQISCAIAAYARLSINPFKNMISNKLYYSDTDSLVLENKLSENIVGKELGQWKLEAIIKKGIFIRPKIYSYYKEDGSLKKVASGVDSKKLTYEDYEAMANGNSVTVNETKMSINWENLKIITFNQNITLKVDCEDNPLNENENENLII
jgi:DNA polymerase type B, organellar and viral